MKEQKINEDVQWCKDFKYNTPVEMAKGIMKSYAERLGANEGMLDGWLLERIQHWAEVKRRIENE